MCTKGLEHERRLLYVHTQWGCRCHLYTETNSQILYMHIQLCVGVNAHLTFSTGQVALKPAHCMQDDCNTYTHTLYFLKIFCTLLQAFLATKEQLQLIGVTAMLIASKYEEVSHPDILDFAYITADSYSEDEILQMERIMLRTLDYRLSYPAPITFLRRFSRIAEVSRCSCSQEY